MVPKQQRRTASRGRSALPLLARSSRLMIFSETAPIRAERQRREIPATVSRFRRTSTSTDACRLPGGRSGLAAAANGRAPTRVARPAMGLLHDLDCAAHPELEVLTPVLGVHRAGDHVDARRL